MENGGEELPTAIVEADMLRLEIYNLRAQLAQRIIADAQRELAEVATLQYEMAMKYRYNVQKDQVQTDGRIVRSN